MKKRNNDIDFEVRISPKEVLRRIAETSDVQQIAFVDPDDKPFLYAVRGNQINIRKRRAYRNDFRSSLSVTVEPTNDGSKLRGRFSIGVMPVIFMIGWLTIVAGLSLISIVGFGSRLAGIESPVHSPFPDSIPIFMFVGGLILFFFARFLAKGEERQISKWLDNLFANSIIKH